MTDAQETQAIIDELIADAQEVEETKAIIEKLSSYGYDDKYIAKNLNQSGRCNFETGERTWTADLVTKTRDPSNLDKIEISKHNDHSQIEIPKNNNDPKQLESIIVKRYVGSHKVATWAYEHHSKDMVQKGYQPTSQSWSPGSYSAWAFIFALLLCFVILGIFVFLYMLLVKPEGILTVTYELRLEQKNTPTISSQELDKTCPRCAETIKKAALVCRYCRHEFE